MATKEEFIEEIPNSEGSKRTYRGYLNTFEKALDTNLDEWIIGNKSKDEYTTDIIKAINKLSNKAPKTVRTIKSITNSFLEFNNIYLDKRQTKRINRKIRGRRAITLDRIPKKHEIKRMLEHTTDPKMRAIILIGSSSGMRIDEILNIKTRHLKLEADPPTIYIPYGNTKDNETRIAFISYEARDSLKAWLKVLPSYVRKKKNYELVRKLQKKVYDKEIIFPLTYDAVRRALIRLLGKESLDEKDISDRYKIHLHSFKKYFKNKMSNKLEKRHLDYLASHDSEMEQAYPTVNEEEIRKDYLENMHNVTIYETTIDYAETEDRIGKLEEEKKELREKITEANKQLNIFEERIRKIEEASGQPSDISIEEPILNTYLNENLNFYKTKLNLSQRQIKDLKKKIKKAYPKIINELYKEARNKNITVLELIDEYKKDENAHLKIIEMID